MTDKHTIEEIARLIQACPVGRDPRTCITLEYHDCQVNPVELLWKGATIKGKVKMTIIHPLDHFHRRFPNSINILYKGYVFHGEYQVLARAPRGFNIMAADVASALMGLYDVGIIEPVRFRPSHSGAAWLGLEDSQRRPHLKPHVGDATHWEWRVRLGDFTYPVKTPTKQERPL